MKKLRVLFATFLFTITVFSGFTTPSAYAGEGYWSTSICLKNGNHIYWKNTPGSYGTDYAWWIKNPTTGDLNLSFMRVEGAIMQAYTLTSWQCGILGAPMGNAARDNWSNPRYQYFERGYIYNDYSGGCFKVFLYRQPDAETTRLFGCSYGPGQTYYW